MTREIKLALILGFALALTVGVRVADHFSTAQNADLVSVDDAATDRSAQPPIQRFIADTAEALGSVFSDESAVELAATSERTTVPQEQAGPPTRSGETDQEPGGLVMGGDDWSARPERPDGPSYTVRPGDSIWRIADDVLGDGNRWRELRELNPRTIASDGTVAVGAVLALPSGANAAAPRQTPPSRAERPRTYTVQAGDSLSEIAKNVLGDGNRWRDILEVNRDVIELPNEIYPGLRLKLPQ